jgi:hypothetical protein
LILYGWSILKVNIYIKKKANIIKIAILFSMNLFIFEKFEMFSGKNKKKNRKSIKNIFPDDTKKSGCIAFSPMAAPLFTITKIIKRTTPIIKNEQSLI